MPYLHVAGKSLDVIGPVVLGITIACDINNVRASFS